MINLGLYACAVSKKKKKAYPNKPVLGFKLLGYGHIVIDQSNSRRASATKLGVHVIHYDLVRVITLVHLSKLGLDFLLGNVGPSLVNDLQNLTAR